MRPKIVSRRTLFLGLIAGSVLSLTLLLDIFTQSGHALDAVVLPHQDLSHQKQAGSGLPVRLKIPKINVDSTVEYADLVPGGAMDVPKNPDDVAWFELGQRPGENGSAVIDGHYGFKDGKPSAFDDLYKLRKGDKLYVENDQGATISFVVRESRRYDPNADASSVFGSDDGKSHLNLITCEGTWDESTHQYSKRLVVFTDKEME